MSVTGYVFSEEFIRHCTLPSDEIESPFRLKAIQKRLLSSSINNYLNHIKIKNLPDDEIELVHPEHHILNVEKLANSFEICKMAVAGAIFAADAICEGKVKNAFCALRPPGHHAFDKGVFGFCYFNNIAITARHIQKKHGYKKILIVDWDYHHGNGTEDAFYSDPTVLYFSTHKLEAFPMTGLKERTGEGFGKGYNINVPLPSGTDDNNIIDAFNKILMPASDIFKPDFVLISAGFDSRENDFLGDFNITDRGFYRLTKIVLQIAEKYSSSRVLSLLEGGYNPKGLAMAVEAHLFALAGLNYPY